MYLRLGHCFGGRYKGYAVTKAVGCIGGEIVSERQQSYLKMCCVIVSCECVRVLSEASGLFQRWSSCFGGLVIVLEGSHTWSSNLIKKLSTQMSPLNRCHVLRSQNLKGVRTENTLGLDPRSVISFSDTLIHSITNTDAADRIALPSPDS